MKPNVLLIVLDSVRAANLSLYGHVNQTSPFLEEFADESTVYRQARAPGIWSGASHASIFTGYHVEEHGINSAGKTLEPGHTVWERLSDEAGYETGLFTKNLIADDQFGLNRGFDEITRLRHHPGLFSQEGAFPVDTDIESDRRYLEYIRASLDHQHTLSSLWNGVLSRSSDMLPRLLGHLKGESPESYTKEFLEWQARTDGPWAACINYMAAHIPYEPPAEYDEWGGEELRNLSDKVGSTGDVDGFEFYSGQRSWWEKETMEPLYDGCIRQLDANLQNLITTLEARGVLNDTLVVVTADHGDGFGETSRIRPGFRIFAHLAGVHERLLHVPLVVNYPGQSERRNIEESATLTRFPMAVNRSLDRSWDGTEFVPDGPVIASATDRYLQVPPDYLDKYKDEIDLSKLAGRAKVVFQNENEGVRKYSKWGDDTATVRIVDAQNSMRVSRKGGEIVERTFADIHLQNVESESSGRIEDESRDRLKDLGYL